MERNANTNIDDDESETALHDGIHDKIGKAIDARIRLADSLLREANSLMRCRPEKYTQVEVARRKEQFPQSSSVEGAA